MCTYYNSTSGQVKGPGFACCTVNISTTTPPPFQYYHNRIVFFLARSSVMSDSLQSCNVRFFPSIKDLHLYEYVCFHCFRSQSRINTTKFVHPSVNPKECLLPTLLLAMRQLQRALQLLPILSPSSGSYSSRVASRTSPSSARAESSRPTGVGITAILAKQ
jgi:hypothetical protein